MNRFRILIVDDQKLFAVSLAGILKSLGSDSLAEVRIAATGEEALLLLDRWHAELILLDIFMPGMGGIEALKRLRAEHPNTKVIMLSTFGYDTYVRDAVTAGASGYLLKDTTPQEVWNSVLTVLSGQTVLSPSAVEHLTGRPRSAGLKAATPDWFSLLSEKEKKILLLISRGLSNEQIAEALHLGKHTVRNYVSALYDKIGVKDRFEAIRTAIEAQIHTLVHE